MSVFLGSCLEAEAEFACRRRRLCPWRAGEGLARSFGPWTGFGELGPRRSGAVRQREGCGEDQHAVVMRAVVRGGSVLVLGLIRRVTRMVVLARGTAVRAHGVYPCLVVDLRIARQPRHPLAERVDDGEKHQQRREAMDHISDREVRGPVGSLLTYPATPARFAKPAPPLPSVVAVPTARVSAASLRPGWSSPGREGGWYLPRGTRPRSSQAPG